MPNQNSQKYDLAGQVIGRAMEVPRELGLGFNEKVYHNALAIELRAKGLIAELEKKFKTFKFKTPLKLQH